MTDSGTIGRVYVIPNGIVPLIAQYLVQALALAVLILLSIGKLAWPPCSNIPLGWVITQGMTRRNHERLVQLSTLAEEGTRFCKRFMPACARYGRPAMKLEKHSVGSNGCISMGKLTTLSTTKNRFIRETLNRLIEWIGLCIVYGWGVWQLFQHAITIGTVFSHWDLREQFYTIIRLHFERPY